MHGFERWRELLRGTADIDAVRRVIRQYVESIDATVILALPPDCQNALQDPDVQAAAVTLLHCEVNFKGAPETGELLHEIAQTFAVASTRITRLVRHPIGPAGE